MQMSILVSSIHASILVLVRPLSEDPSLGAHHHDVTLSITGCTDSCHMHCGEEPVREGRLYAGWSESCGL